MSWFKQMMGMADDRPESTLPIQGKSVTFEGLPSRQDGNNFRTNMVTLAQYNDHMDGMSEAAVGLTATWACVNLVAGTIGSLPITIVQTLPDGTKQIAKDHPLFYPIAVSPNFDQTPLDFYEYMAASIELRGDAFADLNKRSDGTLVSMRPIRPDGMKVERTRAGLRYTWIQDGKEQTRPVDKILHIRGPFGNDLGGASALAVCRKAFTTASSAENAATETFNNGLRPSGVLRTDPSISLTKEQRAELNEYLRDNFQGAINAGRPMLLDRGMDWTQINLSPEDAQMLESRKFSGEEICRVFGVPPAMVAYGDKSSNWGTGKEVDVLGFIKFTLRRRLRRIELSLSKQLLSNQDRLNGYSIEFNMEGLLRGDSQGRSQFYQTMTQMGAMTINEVRRLENLPPVPGGDEIRIQSQNEPISGNGQEDNDDDAA